MVGWRSRFGLVELKPSYWRVGVSNLQRAELESKQEDLFSMVGLEVAV